MAEAITVEEQGLEVPPAPEPEWAAELLERLEEDPELRAGFESLTPGRRREYNIHIASAKRASTRESRVDRCARIRAGKGLRD
ncbi:MAG: YdeI/OmpD-associated family protein [Microthrixaceae bacterium]